MRKGREKCIVENCQLLHHAKKLCKKHWAFQRNYGSLDVRKRSTPNTIIIQSNQALIECFDGNGKKSGELIIDIKDVPLVQSHKWHIPKDPGYGRSIINKKLISLHRLLMGFPNKKVDHINGNRLDNRRANLREVDNFQHAWNTRGRKYIHRSKNGGYVVQIVKNKKFYSKTVRTEKEAFVWREKLLREHYGEYAPL